MNQYPDQHHSVEQAMRPSPMRPHPSPMYFLLWIHFVAVHFVPLSVGQLACSAALSPADP